MGFTRWQEKNGWRASSSSKNGIYSIKKVARCTKIIEANNDETAKYIINIKQMAKFVVGLADRVAPTDIEEGMRVGVDRTKVCHG